ncbi:MAG: septum formation initiator family protein [Bacteroidetes bacterium]|nr:septum formation initiator family protein [Bacteroidota bacterium]
MKDFNKSNDYKFWHSPVALILLFCVLVFFGYKIIDLIKKERETSHEKEIILDKIDSLNKKEVDLNKNIARLETDEGKEEIIREKYPVVKDGEKMVTIVEDEVDKKVLDNKKEEHGFWNWIKGIFNK